MAAASAKSKKSVVNTRKHSQQQAKQKVKKPKLSPKVSIVKHDKVSKKKPAVVPKPPLAPKPAEAVKPEMSEISMNARGVEPTCGVKHVIQRYVLFIGNLPYSVDKGQLMVHFRKTGTGPSKGD